ncbi:MAG: S-layer homology domain-containing protein, partial [Ezakiella massiliensis]
MLATSVLAYSDVKDDWAKPYIDWASDRGLFTGYKDGTFRPEGH